MVVISFVDLQKIWLFTKFESHSSKIVPATSISILNFWRAWQPYFLSQTLQILVSHVSFIDKQMMFYKKISIFDRNPAVFKNKIFFVLSRPTVGHPTFSLSVHIYRVLRINSDTTLIFFEYCNYPCNYYYYELALVVTN